MTDEKRQKHAAYMRQYRQKHPEKVQADIARAKARFAEKKARDPKFRRKQYRFDRKPRYANDPEYRARMAAMARKNYAKVRKTIIDAYGCKCMCCGETEPTFLEIDHVHGGGSRHYREENAGTAYRRIIREGFPERFQLLCCNCNRGRARHGGICPHQLKRDTAIDS